MGWIEQQTKLRTNQYGGVKGCGSEHLLVQLWPRVLENLKDPRAAALLTSIDYAKAFNRLDFAHCLRSLARKGMCRELINIIASFLTGREMVVKVDGEFSNPRKYWGGSHRALSLEYFFSM